MDFYKVSESMSNKAARNWTIAAILFGISAVCQMTSVACHFYAEVKKNRKEAREEAYQEGYDAAKEEIVCPVCGGSDE